MKAARFVLVFAVFAVGIGGGFGVGWAKCPNCGTNEKPTEPSHASCARQLPHYYQVCVPGTGDGLVHGCYTREEVVYHLGGNSGISMNSRNGDTMKFFSSDNKAHTLYFFQAGNRVPPPFVGIGNAMTIPVPAQGGTGALRLDPNAFDKAKDQPRAFKFQVDEQHFRAEKRRNPTNSSPTRPMQVPPYVNADG